MRKKIWIVLGSVVVVTGCGYFWWASRDKDTVRTTSDVSIVTRPATLSRGKLVISVSATGVVSPINVIEVKSKASGIVESIAMEASDHVYAGKVIATLDQTDTRNAFEQALADSQVASAVLIQQENNWKRTRELFEKNLLAQSEYDQSHVDYVKAQSALIKAQASLLLARQKLAETVVRSPVDGVVLSRGISTGQIVSSAVSNVGGGTVIARLANMDAVYVIAAVDEVDIGKVQIDQPARVVADAYPGEEFAGKVIRIAAQATVVQNVTTFDVVVLVPNRGDKLKSGMNATVTIDIARKDNALLIANELLRSRTEIESDRKTLQAAGVQMPEGRRAGGDSSGTGGGKGERRNRGMMRDSTRGSSELRFVVVDEGARLQLKPVRVGLSNADASEVLSGLSDSSRVMLVMYSQALKENERFKDRLKERSGSLGR